MFHSFYHIFSFKFQNSSFILIIAFKTILKSAHGGAISGQGSFGHGSQNHNWQYGGQYPPSQGTYHQKKICTVVCCN